MRAWSRRKLEQACGLSQADIATNDTETVGYIVPETAIAPAGLNPFTHAPERLSRPGMEKGKEETHDPYEAIDPGALLASADSRVCLTEDSGLGKTVFLLWAQGELNSAELDGVAVRWRASAVRWESKDDIIERLGNDLMRLHSGLTTRRAARIAHWLLDHGKVTFLIDALDQTNDDHARGLGEFLDETGAGHACRVVLTSRPYAVRENRGKLFDPDGLGRLLWRFAKLKPFDEPRQRRFLGSAFQQIHSPKEIQDLLGVPMVLRMLRELAIDGRLGALRSRADVYHAAMLALVERGIRTLNGQGTVEPDRAVQILAAIAFQMARDGNFDCQVDGVAVGAFFRRVKNLLGHDAPTQDEWRLVRRLNIATDRSILEGLSRESIGFRHRSVMEFFAGQYLASYADGDRIPAPVRRRIGATLRRQVSSEDWNWVWRFAIEMPAAARDQAISRRTLRILFRRPPADVPRPCELIYRAWDLMNGLPDGAAVLRSFQSEFRAMVNDAKNPEHSAASALDKSFVRCPNKPSLDNQPFQMGSPETEADRSSDETQHRVVVSPFQMSKHTVTNLQFELFDPSHGTRRWGWPPGSKMHPDNDDNCPVVQVSWYDAWAFCRWLGDGYGLPTEAQWEYACRAGTTTAFHYGDSLSSTQANFDGNYPYGKAKEGPYLEKTTPVGSYPPPNAWGLFDMHGNVWEWCADWYDEGYYSRSSERDPTGPDAGDRRVLRGGSWNNYARDARSANRGRDHPDGRFHVIGFRVLCSSRVRTP